MTARQRPFAKSYYDMAEIVGDSAAKIYGTIESHGELRASFKLTQAWLARRHRCSMRTVEYAIGRLKDAGFLTIIRHGPKGSEYVLHEPEDVLEDDAEEEYIQDPATGRLHKNPAWKTRNETRNEDGQTDAARTATDCGFPYKVIESKNVVDIPSEPTHSVRSSEGNQLPHKNASASVPSPSSPPYAGKPEPFRMYMAYCDALGLNTKLGFDPTKGKILGMAKQLHEKYKFTGEDVYRCTKFLMSQDYRGQIIPFGVVYNTIGSWRMKGKPEEDRKRGEKINWQAGGTGRLVH